MAVPQDKPTTGHKVLVAEDDPATLALLRRQLERAGYAVSTCENGHEALNTLRTQGAEIVVADWQMPEMSGIELCKAVQALRESGEIWNLHFILLTAHGDRERVVAGLEAGADDFLRKPYDFSELLARIHAGERILRLQKELTARQAELTESNKQLELLNSKLTRLANFDELTELPNRRHLLERFHAAWEQAGRHGRDLSCAMLDIDRFKRVNDTYGHAVGDEVLHTIAEILQRETRTYDWCGRLGGEEFLIVFPDEAVIGAAGVAERIRRCAERWLHHAGDEGFNVTLSFGVAARRPAHDSCEVLIAEADGLLYEAKGHGRNQIWYANEKGDHQPYVSAASPSVGSSQSHE